MMFDASIPTSERNLVEKVNDEIRIKQATKLGYIVPNDYDGIDLSFPTSKTRRGRVVREKSNCITCNGRAGVYYDNHFRYFSTRELERLQTLPEGYTDCVSPTLAMKAIGNGWTVNIIASIFEGLKK